MRNGVRLAIGRATVLGALIALTPAGVAHGAPAWVGPETISAAGEGASAHAVTMTPRGDTLVAWERSDGSHTRVEVTGRVAGGTFRTAVPVSTAGVNANDVAVAATPDGEAIAVWRQSDQIIAAIGTIAGGLGAPDVVSEGDTSVSAPDVAVDAAGNAVAVWCHGDGRVRTASRPAGGAFGAPDDLDAGPAIASRTPRIAMTPSGEAFVAWTESTGGTWRLIAAHRPARGAFARLPDALSESTDGVGEPVLVMNARGDAAAGFQQGDGVVTKAWVVTGNASGWGTPHALSSGTGSAPDVAIDADGNVLAAWTDGLQAVRAAYRPAGGAFTDPPETLADGPGKFAPQVALPGGGQMVVVWHAFAGARRIWSATGVAGQTFGEPDERSELRSQIADPRIAFDGAGNAVAVWGEDLGSEIQTRAEGFDAAGPILDGLQFPGATFVGTPLAFSVAPLDVWSPLASTGWDFGDGAGAMGTSVVHAYPTPGTFVARVTATDALGNATSDQAAVPVAALAPPPSIVPPGGLPIQGGTGTVSPGDEPASPPLSTSAALVPDGELGTALRRGIRHPVACEAACRVSIEARLAARPARRLGLARAGSTRVATGRARRSSAGDVTVRLRFTAAARRALRSQRRVRLALRITIVEGGERRRVTRRLTLTLRPVPRLRTAAARGLPAYVTCSVRCRATTTLTVDRRTARELGLRSRTIGTGRRTLPGERERAVVTKLTRAARRALAGERTLRATLRITTSAGDETRTTRLAVRLRR